MWVVFMWTDVSFSSVCRPSYNSFIHSSLITTTTNHQKVYDMKTNNLRKFTNLIYWIKFNEIRYNRWMNECSHKRYHYHNWPLILIDGNGWAPSTISFLPHNRSINRNWLNETPNRFEFNDILFEWWFDVKIYRNLNDYK